MTSAGLWIVLGEVQHRRDHDAIREPTDSFVVAVSMTTALGREVANSDGTIADEFDTYKL